MFKVSVTYNDSAEGFQRESVTVSRESDAHDIHRQLLDKYYVKIVRCEPIQVQDCSLSRCYEELRNLSNELKLMVIERILQFRNEHKANDVEDATFSITLSKIN